VRVVILPVNESASDIRVRMPRGVGPSGYEKASLCGYFVERYQNGREGVMEVMVDGNR